MTAGTTSWQEKWHWFALLSLTFLVNVPMLSPTLFFSNDTLHAFIFFHFAYSELLVHNELPRWLPYLGYGTPFDFNLWNTIAPTDYVMMAAGWLCGVTDALLLFKISLILSQGVLVVGLYLLSRRLFTSMMTVWMVCLGGLLTTTWMLCSPWSLTSYYMVPLVLWFLLRFVDSRQPAQLWLAGLAEGLSLLGTVPYIAPLHLLIVLAFLMPFLCREPGLARAFVNWRNFIHPLFFAFVGYFVLLGTWIAGMDVVWLSPGRDAVTGNVPLPTFLGRDGSATRQPLGVMLRILAKGDLYYGELINYVGILPLAMLPYALLRRRDTVFLGVAAAALALFWFSLGGWFTTLTYYVIPTMTKYRFISAAWDFLRIFLLLLAGFGFDQLLRDLNPPRQQGTSIAEPAVFSSRVRWTLGILLACCLLDHLFNGGALYFSATDFVFQRNRPDGSVAIEPWPILFTRQAASIHVLGLEIGPQGVLMIRYLMFAAALGLLWWLVTIPRWRFGLTAPSPGCRWTQAVGPLLLAVYLADVGFFYSQVMKQAPWCPPDTPVEDSLDVQETIYRPRRYQVRDLPGDAENIMNIIKCNRGGSAEKAEQNPYASYFVLMQCDLADYLGTFRLDVMMPAVKNMIEARRHGTETQAQVIMLDLALQRLLGAGLDKARMFRDRDAIFADSEKRAWDEFHRLADPDKKIVIQTAPRGGEGEKGRRGRRGADGNG